MVYPELFPGPIHALALPIASYHPGGTPLTCYPPCLSILLPQIHLILVINVSISDTVPSLFLANS